MVNYKGIKCKYLGSAFKSMCAHSWEGMEICLVTGLTRFSYAESIVSVKREKLPALQNFMNQLHFSVSPGDVTDEMTQCKSLNASLDPFHSFCGVEEKSSHPQLFLCCVCSE